MTSITSYVFQDRGAILREYIRKKEIRVVNYILFSAFVARCIVSIEHVRILFAASCSTSEFFWILRR